MEPPVIPEVPSSSQSSEALKTTKEIKIRGVTRNTCKPTAKALQAKSVETVAVDTNLRAQIKAVLQGVYAVSAVTNYLHKKMDAELANS